MEGDNLKPEMNAEEYFEIREEVSAFLEEKNRKKISAFDKLSSNHKRVVLDNANLVYARSKLIEPAISRDLLSIIDSSVSEFKSFEHRLKTLESLKRKIIADSKEYEGSYLRAANNICDGVRYTIVIDDDMYVLKVDEYLHKLEDMGYFVVDFKNNWGKPFYQGFNVRICCPNREDIFELQFHTMYGYHIKEGSTRDLYQVVRDEDMSKRAIELKKKANRLREFFQKTVRIPNMALEYDFSSRIRLGEVDDDKRK